MIPSTFTVADVADYIGLRIYTTANVFSAVVVAVTIFTVPALYPLN